MILLGTYTLFLPSFVRPRVAMCSCRHSGRSFLLAIPTDNSSILMQKGLNEYLPIAVTEESRDQCISV